MLLLLLLMRLRLLVVVVVSFDTKTEMCGEGRWAHDQWIMTLRRGRLGIVGIDCRGESLAPGAGRRLILELVAYGRKAVQWWGQEGVWGRLRIGGIEGGVRARRCVVGLVLREHGGDGSGAWREGVLVVLSGSVAVRTARLDHVIRSGGVG